ncbi:MAG: PAS domain-containing sensor histidine kinase [Desulfobacterium sp.]|nr:PAS domain-containing sensor histidine kinase [Desulfobacterium sp.]
MDTYFAPAERGDKQELVAKIELINKDPVMSGLLHSVSGVLAILDEHRQIISINDSFLKMLGIEDPSQALGLRPGEALQCIHARDEPAGCGTTKLCSTCGAAMAIVSSLGQDKPVERMCALTANRGDRTVDIALMVKSQPIKINGKRFLLLFLQDITVQQQRAALARTFFHDVNNMLSGLVGASELLSLKESESNLVKQILTASLRLKKEVEIQRCLLQNESSLYQPSWKRFNIRIVMEELRSFFINHPAARNKAIDFQEPCPALSIKTDMSLLLRILCNMITNALEGTKENGRVKVWLEESDDRVSFWVWNRRPIPQEIARRIFQRNFSTKEGDGRGIGTFSMKLFGEQILGGKVGFTTSREEGTVFVFSLPPGGTKRTKE